MGMIKSVTEQRRLDAIRNYIHDINVLGTHTTTTSSSSNGYSKAVERLVAEYGGIRALVCELNAPELAQERCRLATSILEVFTMCKECFSKSDICTELDRIALCKNLLAILSTCARECGGVEARLVSESLFILFATAPPETRFAHDIVDDLVNKLGPINFMASTESAKHVSSMVSLSVAVLLSREQTQIDYSNSKNIYFFSLIFFLL